MGKISIEKLEKATSIDEVARHITRQGWGVCYINGNTILTNIPGWFIGQQGRNIKAYKHLGNYRIVSFHDVGMTMKGINDEVPPYIRAQCGPARWLLYNVPPEMFSFIENAKQFGWN